MKTYQDLIGMREAAKIADETPQNFRHFVLRGETPEPIKIDRFIYFDRQEMENWEKPTKNQGGARKRLKKKAYKN